MILEAVTLDVLENFVSINKSIRFTPGDTLVTCSPTKSILARAKINQKMTKEFCIFDLKKFLSVNSIMKSPDLSFTDSQVVFVQDKAKVKYTFASPDAIMFPKRDSITLPKVNAKFTLTNQALTSVMASVSILGCPEIEIAGEDGKLYLRAIDAKNRSADTFSLEVGETEKEFSIIIRCENLKLLPADYEVSICFDEKVKLAHFGSENVEYWIAIESQSVV